MLAKVFQITNASLHAQECHEKFCRQRYTPAAVVQEVSASEKAGDRETKLDNNGYHVNTVMMTHNTCMIESD